MAIGAAVAPEIFAKSTTFTPEAIVCSPSNYGGKFKWLNVTVFSPRNGSFRDVIATPEAIHSFEKVGLKCTLWNPSA